MGAFVFSAPSLLEIADIPDAFSRNRSQAWTGTGQNAVAAFDPVWYPLTSGNSRCTV
jgi:hypothetical protein